MEHGCHGFTRISINPFLSAQIRANLRHLCSISLWWSDSGESLYNRDMTTLRAFIAIDLPPDVKAALDRVAATLGGRVPRGAVRWVRPEQMHLTLRFLGDTPSDRLPGLTAALDTLAAGHAPFTLRLTGVGCFPNARRPRVVWVGLGREEQRLLALVAGLEAALRPLGWPPEDKPFRAHLTLGRVKDERAAQGVDWATDVPPLDVPVAAVHLIESQLRPDGPVYTVRHTSRLEQ
jgi:2'-5' RNA ligase